MKMKCFQNVRCFFYFVGSWHAAYRLHPRILPDLRNLAKLGHAKLYPRFCWTLYKVADKTSSKSKLSVKVKNRSNTVKEGELYLSWSRCEELWRALVSNPDAVEVDRDKIFQWFQACIRDLEETTQRRLFSERYLQLDPGRVTENTFESFKTFFESVNVQGGHTEFEPFASL